jgi:hypothetical protein
MSERPDKIPTRIISLPGIKRDGTLFEGDAYVDGQWCRFERGLPRKIGGYRSTNKFLREPSTGLSEYTRNQTTYVHSGSANYVERFAISGVASSVISDRTPTSGFTADDRNLWQFAVEGELSGGVNNPLIIAQVAPNGDCLCNDEGGELFSGPLFGTSALTSIALPTGGSATGGIVALHPYLLFFGDDGYVGWSVANDPTDLTSAGSGSANITGQKIVRGMPLRGGSGSTPSGLLWSADSLMRVAFAGGSTVFDFDTISTETSILSPASVVEYDGVFYWIATDRFLAFNGVVREVPNLLNIADFFENLNMNARMKVFGYKVPRFGEIWWCYPRGDSDVCNHAIIFNVRENTWYDTPLPNGGRSAGLTPAVYRYPMACGVTPDEYAQAYDLAITVQGTGYTVGDVLTVVGGSGVQQATEITVTAASGGGHVHGATITSPGLYTTPPTNPVTITGGTGSAATFTLTYVNPYKFWIHEIGYDEVDGQSTRPITSFFETADICFPAQDNPIDAAVRAIHIEPDFVQVGDMTVQAKGRANARAPEDDGAIKTFPAVATNPAEQIVTFKEERRQLRFRFTSDTVGGFYQMGHILGYIGVGSTRVTT